MRKSKYDLQNKAKNKIDEKVAVAQLMEFLEFYELDFNEVAVNLAKNGGSKMTADEIGDQFLDVIMTGDVSMAMDGEDMKVTQTFRAPYGKISQIVYGVLRGKNKLAGSKVESDGMQAQIFEIMGSCSNMNVEMLRKLQGKDLKTMLLIGQLYFLV